jgi:hypothetical protein
MVGLLNYGNYQSSPVLPGDPQIGNREYLSGSAKLPHSWRLVLQTSKCTLLKDSIA